MNIAVLGCGPAGLMAAHGAVRACIRNGDRDARISVFSRAVKSSLYGAQYLHAPIPDATVTEGKMIAYKMVGDTADYRRKVYGQQWLGAVSPEDLVGAHMAWDIRATYGVLWTTYSKAINDVNIDPNGLKDLLDGSDFDVVFNSIPLDALCYQGHDFNFVEIIAAGDAPDLGINVGRQFGCPEDTVICNGEDSPSWYRMSRIFGHTTVEWPSVLERVPVTSASRVRKPTRHNCDCWPTIHNVGRYGTWTKGVLSHEAYNKANEVTEGMFA